MVVWQHEGPGLVAKVEMKVVWDTDEKEEWLSLGHGLTKYDTVDSPDEELAPLFYASVHYEQVPSLPAVICRARLGTSQEKLLGNTRFPGLRTRMREPASGSLCSSVPSTLPACAARIASRHVQAVRPGRVVVGARGRMRRGRGLRDCGVVDGKRGRGWQAMPEFLLSAEDFAQSQV